MVESGDCAGSARWSCCSACFSWVSPPFSSRSRFPREGCKSMARLALRRTAWAIVALVPLARASVGQVALAARASTLGVGAELSLRTGRNLGLRLGGNYLQFSHDATINDIAYHVTPHFENGTAILDLFPFGSPFHLSGGLLLNYNDGQLIATLAHDITIGGTTYHPQDVGSLTGTVTFNQTAPY